MAASRYVEAAGHAAPERLAGRLKARLQYADINELEVDGASALITTVLDDCATIPKERGETPQTIPGRVYVDRSDIAYLQEIS